MSCVNINAVLPQAKEHGYAVGAFNILDYASMRAVVEAAADWANDIPGGNDLPDANAVGEAIMAAADHERCERCNRDRWEGGPDDELHCPDCIHGWRPKGEDDE